MYFADLVSKSAQYCSVNKNDPVGFLLLSEVALGDMYELKKATVGFYFAFNFVFGSTPYYLHDVFH